MSIEKMKLVKVTGNLNKMNAALTTCFEGGFFHPEHVSEKAGADNYHPFDAVNPYLPILAKLEQIGRDCGVDFTPKQKINRETVEVEPPCSWVLRENTSRPGLESCPPPRWHSSRR